MAEKFEFDHTNENQMRFDRFIEASPSLRALSASDEIGFLVVGAVVNTYVEMVDLIETAKNEGSSLDEIQEAVLDTIRRVVSSMTASPSVNPEDVNALFELFDDTTKKHMVGWSFGMFDELISKGDSPFDISKFPPDMQERMKELDLIDENGDLTDEMARKLMMFLDARSAHKGHQ